MEVAARLLLGYVLTCQQHPPRAAIMRNQLPPRARTRWGPFQSLHWWRRKRTDGARHPFSICSLNTTLTRIMSYVTSYPTAVPAVSAIALSPGGAQTADSGIITLSNMSAGPTSLGRLCLQSVVPTEGGADRVFMTRHSLWGPLGNKLAWPQPFWHNVIGHEGGSPTPHPSQRTSILSAQPNLCWALKYMIAPPGHAQNLSFVCIHPAIHPVIIDHKLCCWTTEVLKKKDIVCELINILADLVKVLNCLQSRFLSFVWWLNVKQGRKGGVEHETKEESGLV